MMSIARFFSIFAIVAMISAPAMACCLSGHTDSAHVDISVHHDAAAAASNYDCHDNMAGMATNPSPTAPDDPDCTGCVDCEATLANADEVLQPAPVTGNQTPDLITSITIRFSGFDTPRLIQATGPPRLDQVAKPTLIQLKQILLI